MSSDFYLKAQMLYAEFQKKELHYLNAERKLSDSLMWKKDHHVPLQEHLQKLHQREKQNEQTYQSIMKQMNELDQRTDSLCSKIEKLRIFANIQVGHHANDTNYPLTSKFVPQTQNNVQNFSTKSNLSQLELNSLKPSMLKAVSTQTESSIYCDNCKPLNQISQIQNSTSSTIDILSVSKDEPLVMNSSNFQNDSFSFLGENDKNSQFIRSSLNSEHFLLQDYGNEKYVGKTFDNKLQTHEKIETKFPISSMVLEKEQYSPQIKEAFINENTVKASGNIQILSELQSKSNDSEINVEISVSKSDAESVNNEFDFLETDATHLASKTRLQNSIKNNTILTSGLVKKIDHPSSSNAILSVKSSEKPKNEIVSLQTNKEQQITDNRSETSGSVSGTRSPVISLSDSDSVNEKGSFSASAAYQSLLGNTVFPSNINKQVSESESDDEAEKTLAHTVQKSKLKTKSSVEPKKDKSASQSIEDKLDVNRPKSISINNPQSKLSKSTKKVLKMIDTSSSSEVESTMKPPENKKDEDSDEFDFYD